MARRLAALGVYWVLFLFFVLNQQYAVLNAAGQWHSWGQDGSAILLWFVPWIPLSAFLLFAAVRLPLTEYRPFRNLLLLFVVVVIVAHARLALAVVMQSLGLTESPQMPMSWSGFEAMVVTGIHRELLNGLFIMSWFTANETYRAAVDRSRRAAILQSQLSEAELRYLRSQLQPHFLFNALNAVTTLIRKDPVAAEKTMGDLSQLLRRALDDTDKNVVTVARELEFLEHYLAIQRVRFGERLRIRIEADEDVLDALIPGMVLQLLVENAVRHSISRRDGGAVAVQVRREDGDVVVRVTDDGEGMESASAEGAGLGIANVRSRLEHLFGDRGGIRIFNVPGAFTIEVRVPGEPA